MGLKFSIAILLLFLSPLAAFSNSYQRGNYYCGNFKEAEQDYKAYPDSDHAGGGYAKCLILRNEDNKGLSILRHIADRHDSVDAAFTLAEYIQTGGRFNGKINSKNINEAIAAYQRVIFFIDKEPTYPFNGNVFYEMEAQLELVSYYRVPLLFDKKFSEGANGTENKYLLQSPSYKGRRDLNTYPEYSPYTVDSLRKTIRFANRCLALPKKRHFQIERYEKIKAACQLLRDSASALLPLEGKRLDLLAIESCSGDLPQCYKYYKIKNEMIPIIKEASFKINEIFD